MEIYEFDSDRAETDLITHAVTTEAPRLGAGSGVLLCGREAVLQERLAVALAAAVGGALVSPLTVARHTPYQHAIHSGTPVILLTDLMPHRALTLAHNGGLIDLGWSAGDHAVRTLLAGARRYIHVARDNDLQCLRVTSGALAGWTPSLT